MAFIFEKLTDWISTGVGALLNLFVGMLTTALRPDISEFNKMFPEMGRTYAAIQVVGGILLIMILLFQVIRIMLGSLSDNSESPLKLVIRSMFFLFLILNASLLMDTIIGLAVKPYELISDGMVGGSTLDFAKMSGEMVSFGTDLETEIGGNVDVTGLPLNAGALVNAIIMIMIGWNYLKLLLEVVERYLILGVMYYTSPLALAMGGAESTSSIFKSWTRMLGSQLILMTLNIWFLRVINSGLTHFINLDDPTISGIVAGSPIGSKTLALLGVAGMLRIAQRMDTYLAALGINTAQTGQGLSADLLAAGMTLKTIVGGASNAIFGRGGAGGQIGNAIAGTANPGTTASSKAMFQGGSVSGLAEARRVASANSRMASGKVNSSDKKAVMDGFNSTNRAAVNKGLENSVMKTLAPEFGKRPNAGTIASGLAAGVAGSQAIKGGAKASQTMQGGVVAGIAGSQAVKNGIKMGTVNSGGVISSGTGASPFGKQARVEDSGIDGRYKINSLSTTGGGGVMGQMDVDGQLTNFAITRNKPSNGMYAQETTLADGSTGYVQYDNKEAVLAMSDYGQGAYPVGSEGLSYHTYQGEEAKAIMSNISGLDSEQYNAVTFGNDGQTLLSRADGLGTMQVMPLGAVNGDYDGEIFTGENDGMTYGLQPYSGTAFSRFDNPEILNEQNDKGLFTQESTLVQSLNSTYEFSDPPQYASIHRDEDNIMDYITVIDGEGNSARLYDSALIEHDKDYGAFASAKVKEGDKEKTVADIFVEYGGKNGEFKGMGVRSKKKLWYEQLLKSKEK